MSLTRARRRQGWRWVLQSPVMVVVLLCIIILLSISVYQRFLIEREAAAERREAEAELQALQTRYDGLSAEVEYLSDPAGVGREIRKYFDVAKDGEQVVVLVDDERPTAKATLPTTSPAERSATWWRMWWPW